MREGTGKGSLKPRRVRPDVKLAMLVLEMGESIIDPKWEQLRKLAKDVLAWDSLPWAAKKKRMAT